MKVLLINVDSIIPNLALMKISAFHKQNGDKVFLNSGIKDPDKVYISCIFNKNRSQTKGISKMFNCEVSIGGYGVNNNILPDDIERLMPDYSIYNGRVCQTCGNLLKHCKCPWGQPVPGDMYYSMGYATRGCIRNCPWCIVPKKEGTIRINADIYEFLDVSHRHLVLLDNNILAMPKHFKNIADEIQANKLTIDFNQGLDIRLVDDKIAEVLSSLSAKPSLRFAFDDVRYEDDIIRGIKILKNHGINRSRFYVLVGYNTTFKEDLYRLNLLKDHDQRVYVMRYETCNGQRMYNHLAAWGNQPRFFASMSFERFCECRDNRSLMGKV